MHGAVQVGFRYRFDFRLPIGRGSQLAFVRRYMTSMRLGDYYDIDTSCNDPYANYHSGGRGVPLSANKVLLSSQQIQRRISRCSSQFWQTGLRGFSTPFYTALSIVFLYRMSLHLMSCRTITYL